MKVQPWRNGQTWPNSALPHAAVRGGDAGGLAAGVASRAAGTSIATVTTSLAAVELCDEDVAMRCSAQSDAGSAADPEWEAVLAQLLAEEAEEEELCCRFERRGDDSDDGWDNYSEEEEEEDGHAAVQGVAGKVNEPLEGSGTSRLVSPVEDSVCRRRLPPRWVITPATASKRASTFNKQESRVTACLHQTCHPSRS